MKHLSVISLSRPATVRLFMKRISQNPKLRHQLFSEAVRNEKMQSIILESVAQRPSAQSQLMTECFRRPHLKRGMLKSLVTV